jgi:pimeloyl-ACP methyl ester carboxylesterase
MTGIPTLLLTRPVTRRRNAHRLANNQSPHGIYEARYITVGGIQQWITIRGDDRRNPILFFLHGGPGMGHTMFNPLIYPWERHFTLVQWDQRGSGKTRSSSGPLGEGEWTLERLESDAVEVARSVLAHLGQDKLVLVASSVGSTFGLSLARYHPELLHAYVGTDQHTGPATRRLSHQITLDWLRHSGNTRAARAIEAIGTDPDAWTADQTDLLARWAVKANPTVPNMITDVVLPALIGSPEHTLGDLYQVTKGMAESMAQWNAQVTRFDPRCLGTDFAVPVLVLQGDSDAVTPVEAVRDYLDAVNAPRKELVLINNSGHLAMFTRPHQFLEELLRWVRPQAVPADSPALHP